MLIRMWLYGKKVWWICEKNHEWVTTPNHRLRGQGCPYCSNQKVLKGFNDFESTNKELMKDWDYSKNTIDPSMITKGSSKKVWWKCSICGNEWESKISHRTAGSGCPKCYLNNKRLKKAK